jgi:DNA repair exonuclease SbcCD ATPase subunit
LSRRTKTFEDDRHRLERQLNGWASVLPHIAAERDRAAAEAFERAEAERAQAEAVALTQAKAEALAQARQAERERRQLDQERRQLAEDRARLGRVEAQQAAWRQAAARQAQQQNYERFWAEIAHGLDQMIARPAQPVAQPVPVYLDEVYEGSTQLGDSDFAPHLLADVSKW